MRFSKFIFAVDSHTLGEPTRVVISGVPGIPGATMGEKKAYLAAHCDWLRTSLMHEPRGHRDMFGSIITPPASPGADLGIVFMDGGGYLDMCGHGVIGAATVAAELGLVDPAARDGTMILDTPAGLVRAHIRQEAGSVREVTVGNVPAFVFRRAVPLAVPGVGEVAADVAFGGNFFALVEAGDLGVRVEPRQASRLVELGLIIREKVNEAVQVSHPELGHIKSIDLVEICDRPAALGAHCRNAVVFGAGQLDRSPCGTGTCAKMAVWHAAGKLALHAEFIQESILGTTFRGQLLEETRVGEFPAVVPEITASAHITCFNQFFIDPADPLKDGFVLG